MSAFTETFIPKPVNRHALERSFPDTVKECNKVLRRLGERKIAKIGGWLPQKLGHGSHKARINALMAVYRYEINAVRALALETESFRRLYSREQELLRTKLVAKTSPEDHREMYELLWRLQREEIQAAQKKDERCGQSARRRQSDARKAARREKDRRRTWETKGGARKPYGQSREIRKKVLSQ